MRWKNTALSVIVRLGTLPCLARTFNLLARCDEGSAALRSQYCVSTFIQRLEDLRHTSPQHTKPRKNGTRFSKEEH